MTTTPTTQRRRRPRSIHSERRQRKRQVGAGARHASACLTVCPCNVPPNLSHCSACNATPLQAMAATALQLARFHRQHGACVGGRRLHFSASQGLLPVTVPPHGGYFDVAGRPSCPSRQRSHRCTAAGPLALCLCRWVLALMRGSDLQPSPEMPLELPILTVASVPAGHGTCSCFHPCPRHCLRLGLRTRRCRLGCASGWTEQSCRRQRGRTAQRRGTCRGGCEHAAVGAARSRPVQHVERIDR